MPELPEVETIRRQLGAAIGGSVWRRVTARPCSLFRTPAAALAAGLTGARVTGVDRRGKVLLIGFDGDRVLLAHLGMSGQILLVPPAEPDPGHHHLVADLADGRTLVFRDPRRFGYLRLAARGGLEGLTELAGLGPDPLGADRTWEAFLRSFAERDGAVKSALLDQRRFPGIGNVYADEILHVARIRPGRSVSGLTQIERKELYHAIRDVLHGAIELGGTSFDGVLLDIFGRPGLHGGRLRVYGRQGEACDRCHHALKSAAVGGRMSVYCPHCQK